MKLKDITGDKYNYLTAIRFVEFNIYNQSRWLYRCDCGKEKILISNEVRLGKVKSCGHLLRENGKKKIKNLKGSRFGYLFVESLSDYRSNKGGSAYWNCICDCGNRCIIKSNSLVRGHSASCGCKRDLCKFKKKDGAPLRMLYHGYMRGAKARNLKFDLTIEQFNIITQKKCIYCGELPNQVAPSWSEEIYIYNGIDRINSDIGYDFDNIVPCCSKCNYAKQSLSVDEFKRWVIKVYTKLIADQWV